MRIASLLGTLVCFLIVALLLGLRFSTVLQPGAAVGVVGITFFVALFRLGPDTVRLGLRQVFVARKLTSKEESSVRRFSDNIGGIAMLAGHLTALIAMIQVFTRMAEPEHIGWGMAVALVGYVYAALLALLLPTRPETESP